MIRVGGITRGGFRDGLLNIQDNGINWVLFGFKLYIELMTEPYFLSLTKMLLPLIFMFFLSIPDWISSHLFLSKVASIDRSVGVMSCLIQTPVDLRFFPAC